MNPIEQSENAIRQSEALARRQEELRARGRDLTKEPEAPGRNGESLRSMKGFEGITDEILAERANFDAKRMAQVGMTHPSVRTTIDLTAMTAEELAGLKAATEAQLAQKGGE